MWDSGFKVWGLAFAVTNFFPEAPNTNPKIIVPCRPLGGCQAPNMILDKSPRRTPRAPSFCNPAASPKPNLNLQNPSF